MAAPASRPRASLGVRGAAALVLGACVGVLAVAAALEPDPRGIGTHERLVRGPCGLLVTTGFPCPTCGMTTAFSYAIRGQWVRAFWSQPVGLLLFVATAGLAGLAAIALARGAWPRVGLFERYPLTLMLAFLVVFFAGWGFKILAGLSDGTLPWGK